MREKDLHRPKFSSNVIYQQEYFFYCKKNLTPHTVLIIRILLELVRKSINVKPWSGVISRSCTDFNKHNSNLNTHHLNQVF